MNLDNNQCYQALVSHDSRFDGAFFVGVTSTGIYCRTVCPARTPLRENCTFHASAAAAERAGFRPCLRCRPERAPGFSRIDSVSQLASRAASLIEDGALAEGSVEDLAAALSVSSRHLRRVVEREFGVSPIALAQTQRLLLARRLLSETAMPVTEVAFSSGFASLTRFNALFRARYGINPTEMRARLSAALPETLVFDLSYRPPLDWRAMLDFLSHRTIAGVEAVDSGGYHRTARVGARTGWIRVTHHENRTVRVEVSSSLSGAAPTVLARVKRLFDLAADPYAIARGLEPLSIEPGLRVPGAFDGFEMAVRAVLGQQISVKAARTLACRYGENFGEPIQTPIAGLTHLSPTPARVAAAQEEELAALGMVRARANCIRALASAAALGEIELDRTGNVEAAIAALKQLPGIGDWTAQYIAMRALGWPDAFPHTDLGVYKALGETNPKRVLEIAQAWRPWRAYAVMHLWTQ